MPPVPSPARIDGWSPSWWSPSWWTLAGWGLLALVAAAALTSPLLLYDSWMYHLPFAARLWDLPGARAFVMEVETQERWRGYPLAWHWLLGLAWTATGSLRAVVLPQLVLAALFLAYLRRALGIPPAMAAFGLLASPMLLIHAQALYIDLPTGLCLALGFLALLGLLDAARAPAATVRPLPAVLAIAAIGLAGNIKYQGMIGAALVLAIAAALALLLPGIAARRRLALLGVIAACGVLAGATPAANLARLGAPFHPLDLRLAGLTLSAGREQPADDANPPAYLLAGGREVRLPGPLNYVLSLTELDWTLRGVAPWYNVDALAGMQPRRGPPSRTGGLGAAFVLANLALLGWQALHRRRLADGRQRILVLGAWLLLVFAAFLPRAHELRYWLVVPLMLVAVNLRFLAGLGWPTAARAGLAVLMLHGATLALLSPRSALLARPPVGQQALRDDMPPEVAAALARSGRFCDAADQTLFRFSAAATGLPGLLSRDPADCR